MSGRGSPERSMMSSADSITSRLRRPRKSILSRPISSIGFIPYWVTILYERSPFSPVPRSSASCTGTISVSGRSEITTPAAWMPALRTMPSRPLATSMIRRACSSSRYAVASSWPSFRQSSNDGGRPWIGSGIIFARRSPAP
jgi:hypothetical protein